MIKYISFDVFDTLVKRLISCKELYEIMELQLKEKNILIENFAEKRIKAEKNLKFNKIKYYTLQDIYNESIFDEITEKQKENIVELEKELEIKNCVINKIGLYYYNLYKDKAKIIYISDMYLDKMTLKKILEKNGYDSNHIYISSEYKASKYDRSLFKNVLNDLKIKPRELLHIGDAKKSDFLNPRLLGIKSILVRNSRNSYLKKLDMESYLNYLGNDIFGPMMYGFCKWLQESKNKNENYTFVAREGDFIKQCYDILYPNDYKLVYFSRKSVIAGIIYELIKKENIENIIKMMSFSPTDNIEKLCKRLGLSNNIINDLTKNNIDKNSNNYELLYKYIRNNKKFILNETKENNYIFKKYLEQNELYKTTNTLVDIGWKGSMQNLLNLYNQYIGQNVFLGKYLGCIDNNKKSGYLFSSDCIESQKIINFSGILELIMMPSYGSTIDYKINNEKVVPLMDQNEFSKESLLKINQIQSGIKEYLNNIKIFRDFYSIPKDKVCFILNKFGNRPYLKEIKYFANIEFYFNGEYIKLIDTKFKKLKYNFLNSKWKTGFLKQFFKIDLPYEKLIIFIKRNR